MNHFETQDARTSIGPDMRASLAFPSNGLEGSELQNADRSSSLSNVASDDNNASAPACLETHRVLRPMRRRVERLFDEGRFERAFPLLRAVILLDSKPSFLRGSAHQRFNSKDGGR